MCKVCKKIEKILIQRDRIWKLYPSKEEQTRYYGICPKPITLTEQEMDMQLECNLKRQRDSAHKLEKRLGRPIRPTDLLY